MIVDSPVWIDFLNGRPTFQTDVLAHAVGRQEIGLGDINICEVLQGFHAQSDFDQAKEADSRFS